MAENLLIKHNKIGKYSEKLKKESIGLGDEKILLEMPDKWFKSFNMYFEPHNYNRVVKEDLAYKINKAIQTCPFDLKR